MNLEISDHTISWCNFFESNNYFLWLWKGCGSTAFIRWCAAVWASPETLSLIYIMSLLFIHKFRDLRLGLGLILFGRFGLGQSRDKNLWGAESKVLRKVGTLFDIIWHTLARDSGFVISWLSSSEFYGTSDDNDFWQKFLYLKWYRLKNKNKVYAFSLSFHWLMLARAGVTMRNTLGLCAFLSFQIFFIIKT